MRNHCKVIFCFLPAADESVPWKTMKDWGSISRMVRRRWWGGFLLISEGGSGLEGWRITPWFQQFPFLIIWLMTTSCTDVHLSSCRYSCWCSAFAPKSFTAAKVVQHPRVSHSCWLCWFLLPYDEPQKIPWELRVVITRTIWQRHRFFSANTQRRKNIN